MAERRTIIANWKMNLDIRASVKLARDIRKRYENLSVTDAVELILCPSYDSLAVVYDVLSGSGIAVGAQDVFWQEKGAYTGEISAAMLLAAGASHVILGHSERRQYLHETDEIVNRKVRAALAASLTPIVCVGETLAERGEGVADLVLARQVIEGLKGIPLTTPQQQLIIAYEPVWVIGTGQAVEPSAAAHAAHVVRQALIDLLPAETVDRQTRIIYGGSADADNIEDFVSIAAIRGVLVGTASLKFDTFMNLVERTAL